MLDEREFELINILGSGEGANQRVIAEKTGLSLGMVNMLIRRLATKGILRVKQLNQKKVEYLLTPKGFAEKMRKSVNYTMKTLDSLRVIKDRLKDFVMRMREQDQNCFIVFGNDDLVELLDSAFKQYFSRSYEFKRTEELPAGNSNVTILVCREVFDRGSWPEGTVFVVDELVKE